MDKMKMESPDMTAQNIDRIAALFPNCITETVDENGKLKRAINFELLKQVLSPDVVDGDERYEFTWVGKKAAIVEANKPIRKTLRPCKEESKNWDTTENLYIEGDNLEVLKLLQESYLGKVKMIYIDPPYNTGNDFIYADDFKRSQEEENEQMGMFDEDGDRLFKNTDTNGRFHSDWCSMIYSRLMLARNLLTDDGVIFISIDDNEQENLKKCCDEVFGGQNFVATFPWRKRTAKSDVPFGVSQDCEWVICYAKSGKFAARVAGTERKYFETPDFPGRPWRIHDLTKQTSLMYQRNNKNYEMLINICYFVLDGMLQTTDKGNYKMMTFSDEHMHRLYEKFVLEYFKRHHSYLSEVRAAQVKWNLATDTEESMIRFLPAMQTDIFLRYKEKVLIIDTKYYGNSMQKQYDKVTIHSGNMYQIFTYVKNQDVENNGRVSGMLLYAKTEEAITPDCSFVIGGNKISVKTVDLNKEFKLIAAQLDKIAEDYFGKKRIEDSII